MSDGGALQSISRTVPAIEPVWASAMPGSASKAPAASSSNHNWAQPTRGLVSMRGSVMSAAADGPLRSLFETILLAKGRLDEIIAPIADAVFLPKPRAATIANGGEMPTNAPPFRADHVGSLLRPADLKQARASNAAGTLSRTELTAVED